MLSKVYVGRPDEWDVMGLVANIRPADYAEWYAQLEHRDDVAKSIAVAALRHTEGGVVRVLRVGTRAVAIWGSRPCEWPIPPYLGAPTRLAWMVATKEAEKHVLSLHRVLKQQVREAHAGCSTLVCYADERNTLHHKWLEHFGFKFTGRAACGPNSSVALLEYTHHLVL